MGKSLSYEFIKKEFNKNNLILLEKFYTDNNTPMLCKNEDGYFGYVKYSNLQFGKKFKPFSKRNPKGVENLKLFFKNKKIKSKILFNEMPDSKEKVKFQCECGTIFYCDLTHVINRGFCRCGDCATKGRSEKRKHSKEIVKKVLLNKGYKMLQNFYENNNSYIEVEDESGYRGFVTYNGLKTENKQMGKFDLRVNRKYFIYNINVFCKNHNIKTKAIKILYKNYQKTAIVEFLCDCGETFYSTYSSFIFGGKNRCDICSGKMSSYEIKVMNWLNKNKIKFIQQKRYDDCRNIIPLPFDFYIEKYNILIEVDGQGHFNPVRYNGISEKDATETFNRTKNNDSIKNKYCINNNIQLIRIPYYEFKDKKYIKILKDNLLE